MKYKSGRIVTSGHNPIGVVGFEDLWYCTRCNCAEGTLPTTCPGVRVPYRVQDLIIKGVVDYVGGRWVGKRRPLVVTIRLIDGVEQAAKAFRNVSRAFAQAAKSIRDFFPPTDRAIALERLFLITGRDRVACDYDRRVTRTARSKEWRLK